MTGVKLLSVLVLFLGIASERVSGKYSEELQVRLSHGGGVSGHFRTSHSGHGILAFTNIPYAEPPVGDLRFADPVKIAPWTGYLPSNTLPTHCPQKQTYSRETVATGTEDCLYLNVYVRLGSEKRSDLPVMVHIHGGGFTVGSGSLASNDPAFILDSDVILVSINYRLGSLGFLATSDDHFTGNQGMKDQQLALKWVQENIHAFGGDNEKVTVFGVSAGGASVGLHMMSPGSRGLFQRAIMQSGTPYDRWVLQDRELAGSNAQKLFKLVGCEGVSKDQLLKCLKKVKTEDIMETAYDFFEWDVDPLVPFGPVVESSHSPNAFLRKENLQEIADVPLIIGVTNDEGAFKSAMVDVQKDLIADLDSTKFDQILPSILCYSHLGEDVRREVTQRIKSFYLPDGGSFKWDTHKFEYTKIVSDAMFVAGFDQFLRQRLASDAQSETFVYVFNYNGESSFTDILINSENPTNWGASHGSDLLYLFPMIKLMAPHRIMSERDLDFGARFVKTLTDFASYGAPAHTSTSINWTAATKNSFDYLRMGNCNREVCPKGRELEFAMEKNPFTERLKLWRELNSLLNPSSESVPQHIEL